MTVAETQDPYRSSGKQLIVTAQRRVITGLMSGW